jgi:hypothetical protein
MKINYYWLKKDGFFHNTVDRNDKNTKKLFQNEKNTVLAQITINITVMWCKIVISGSEISVSELISKGVSPFMSTYYCLKWFFLRNSLWVFGVSMLLFWWIFFLQRKVLRLWYHHFSSYPNTDIICYFLKMSFPYNMSPSHISLLEHKFHIIKYEKSCWYFMKTVSSSIFLL